jgi:hypothetical protein
MFQESDVEDLFRRTLHLECDEPLRQIQTELKQLDDDLGRLGVDGNDPSAPAVSNDRVNDDGELSREAAIDDLETFVSILDQVVARTESEFAVVSGQDHNNPSGATQRTDLLSHFLKLYSGELRHQFGHVLAECNEAREAVIRLTLRLYQIGESCGSTTQSAGDLLLFALGGRDARAQFPSVATAERLLYSSFLPGWLASWTEAAEGLPAGSAPSTVNDLGEVDPTVLQYLFWNDLRWQKKLLGVVVRNVETRSVRAGATTDGDGPTDAATTGSSMMALSAIVFCSLGLQVEESERFQWIPSRWIERHSLFKLKSFFRSADHVRELSTIFTENLFPSLVSVSRKMLKSRQLTAREFLQRVYRPSTEQLRCIGDCIDHVVGSHPPTSDLDALSKFPRLLASGLYRILLCVEEQQKINVGQPVKRNRILDPTVATSGREKHPKPAVGGESTSATATGPSAPSSGGANASSHLRHSGRISMEDIELIALQQGLIVRPTDHPSSTGQPVHLVLKAADSSNVEFAVPVSYFYIDNATHSVMFKSKRRDPFQKMETLQQIFTPKSD